MTTPSYQGEGQSRADEASGWLGRFGSFFGGATPAYAGVGQPSTSTSQLGRTPAYAPAPSVKPTVISEMTAEGECPIDPAALAAGQIAIVIPRLGLSD
jgi:hypothetical protein